jgi:hypothetical protein
MALYRQFRTPFGTTTGRAWRLTPFRCLATRYSYVLEPDTARGHTRCLALPSASSFLTFSCLALPRVASRCLVSHVRTSITGIEAPGGHGDTFAGLAGMGDLIVTCTSQRSRNRYVGEQLGAGNPIDEIIASMNQVAEGVKAASVIMEFALNYGLSMPIAREVDAVINHGATPKGAYRGLAAERPGHEVHGAGF